MVHPLLVWTALWVGFNALGLGLGLRLRAWLDVPARFLCVLVAMATAVVSYAVLWVVIAWPAMRSGAVAGAVLASAAMAMVVLRDPHERRRAMSRAAWGPAAIGGLLCLAYLWPLLVAPTTINRRLAWELPADNILPGIVAQRVVSGAPVPPRDASDRETDRPPLQAAVVVAVGALVRGGSAEYQILATLCQAQWLPAIWLLGAACGVPGRRLAYVIAACALSGFFFINTVYTWPKLFAASFMLGALAIAIGPPSEDARANRARVIVVFGLCALSLLAHPGPGFTLLAIPVCWPVLRPIVQLRMTWSAVAAGTAVAAALFTPWLAYQAFVDPPTGRLIREHLADGRKDGSVVHAIVAANAARPIGEHVRVRLAHVASQLGDPSVALWPFPWQRAQQQQFFRLGASLGLLLIGIVLVLAPWPHSADPAADPVRRLAIVALVALLIWSLLVFPVDGALIHHGSPVTTALLFFAGACGLTRLPWSVQLIALGLHTAAFLLIWVLPILRTAQP